MIRYDFVLNTLSLKFQITSYACKALTVLIYILFFCLISLKPVFCFSFQLSCAMALECEASIVEILLIVNVWSESAQITFEALVSFMWKKMWFYLAFSLENCCRGEQGFIVHMNLFISAFYFWSLQIFGTCNIMFNL